MSKLVTPFQGVNGPGLGFPDVYTKQNLKISNLVIFEILCYLYQDPRSDPFPIPISLSIYLFIH